MASSNRTISKDFMRKAFCGLFLFVFFAKMVISVAPLIVGHFDKDAIHAVLMQLEIEKESKEDSLEKEKFGKEFWDASHSAILPSRPVSYLKKISPQGDKYKHQSFYPTVPTPPPDQV